MKTLLDILRSTEEYLGRKGMASPRVEAEWLVAHALGMPRVQLYVQFERPLSEADLALIRPLLRRRAEGEPLQYILGSTGFHKGDLLVGPGVLVPRPETERLVEIALAKYAANKGPILDLCTGSGAILLALAGDLTPLPYLLGVDVSEAAMAWARKNTEQLGIACVEWRIGDLFAPVDRHDFGLITANPPYVTEAEYASLPLDVRNHEPREALVAGADGLDVIRRIAAQGRDYLAPEGWLVMEIGEAQGAAVQALLTQHGWRNASIVQDYSHRDRVAVAQA